jgi:hypothetical protein
MKDKLVKTYDGTLAKRGDCRYISGVFYIKNVHCFLMSDDRWYRINSSYIEFDNETMEWVLKSNSYLAEGIIRFDSEENPVFGKFTPNSTKNTHAYYKGTKFLVISEDILPKDKFAEYISADCFVPKTDVNKLYSKSDLQKKCINFKYPLDVHYTFEYQYPVFKDTYDRYFTYISTLKEFYKELGGSTFGLEYETHNGAIPTRHCLRTGLIPLKDGSLRHDGIQPYEYTCIPLSGEKGLHAIKEHCDLLSKYCIKSTNGSLHIHVGSIPISPEYAVSVYSILKHIQDELYDMFPKYYRNTSLFKPTGKDYCRELNDLNFDSSVKYNLDKMFDYYIYGRRRTTANRRVRLSDNNSPEEPSAQSNAPAGDRRSTTGLSDDLFQRWMSHTQPMMAGRIRTESAPVSATPGNEDEALEAAFEGSLVNEPSGRDTAEEVVAPRPTRVVNKKADKKEAYYIGMPHPRDGSNNFDHKWNIDMRYCHTNLINLLFGKRGTVEFRLHTASFNKDKIINWLFIVNAICKFSYKYRDVYSSKPVDQCLTLADILANTYSTSLSSILISYVEYRKQFMSECFKKHNDGIGTIDVEADNLNGWSSPIKSLI